MDIHKLLKRQLDKSNISVEKRPENDEQWCDFIARINRAYQEEEQARYIHERSMRISSRELMILNKKLEDAQLIAKMGYWSYDGNINNIHLSKELLAILKKSSFNCPPTKEEFFQLVHENDRYELIQNIERTLKDRVDYECEIRLRRTDGAYHWYKTIGQCQKEENKLEGIMIDIHKSKIAEEKIKELDQKLIAAARRSGMVEVATTILHNIGNILNSSNVSVTLLKDSFNKNYVEKLYKVLEVLAQHEEDLPEFLMHDPKGIIVPKYLLALSKMLLENYEKNNVEVDNLTKNLKHIAKIVDMQKSISGVSSINEKVSIREIIDLALSMSINPSLHESIKIIREFRSCPLIYVDKSKLLQILINLIQNARDAVLQTNSIKEIRIAIKYSNSKSLIQIFIKDNGVGIASENLNRIFSFGFTTKKNGHGFGLHGSILAAHDMGGALLAESKGEGLGAQFKLTLPTNNVFRGAGVFDE